MCNALKQLKSTQARESYFNWYFNLIQDSILVFNLCNIFELKAHITLKKDMKYAQILIKN